MTKKSNTATTKAPETDAPEAAAPEVDVPETVNTTTEEAVISKLEEHVGPVKREPKVTVYPDGSRRIDY